MLLDTLAEPIDRRRGTRLLLLAIIVLSLPCYCLGFVLLAYAPGDNNNTTPRATNPTLGGITSTPFTTPTPTRFGPSATPTQYGNLLPTPGQIYLRTNTPFVWPTAMPTWTSIPWPTFAPTLTAIPTNTLAPSPTLKPTDVPPPPTDEPPPPTDEPPPPPTDEPPPPTTEPVIEASPTQETLSETNTG